MLSALASTDEADLLIRGDQWLAPRVAPLPLPSGQLPGSVLVDEGTYVITGAFGPVGLRLAAHLAKRCRARLVLIGRRELPPREDWEARAAEPGSATATLAAAMLRMERDGAVVLPVRADVSSLDQLRGACQAGLEDGAGLTGIIHAAGVADPGTFPLICDTHAHDVEGHFLAKLSGTRNVAAVARAFRPDFVLAVSSLATLLGGLGFGAYSAANACLESIARDASTSETPWTVLNLDGWERDDGSGSPFRAGAGQLITGADADLLFDRVFRLCGLPTVLVSTTDLPERSDRAADVPVAPAATADGASAPYPRPELPSAYRAPDDELEACLTEICADLLRVDRVGVDDDFFLLGGHSLLAMQLLARLNAEFGVDLPLRSVFDSPTAAGLAQAMEAAYLRGEVIQ
jgi:NAD(P)-dependent dehydrogenase (short-subunit alcohol dehydrogenase family)/acyl carrier protein